MGFGDTTDRARYKCGVSKWRLPTRPISNLTEGCWTFRGLDIAVRVPRIQELRQLDDEWRRARPENDTAAGWVWETIANTHEERFQVFSHGERGSTLALWAGKRSRPLVLPRGPTYRADYFEVSPFHRAAGFSLFCLALQALRALEVEATGIVFGAHAERADYWRGLPIDIVEGPVEGWQTERGLLPFTLPLDTLEALGRLADVHRKK